MSGCEVSSSLNSVIYGYVKKKANQSLVLVVFGSSKGLMLGI
jgi:hypothetical protein